jgi:AAA ATPase domain
MPAGADSRLTADACRSAGAGGILLAMAGTVASSRFVGRTAELDRLEAAFAYARGGDLVTLCVGGEAGVGKTRLVSRFAAQVRERGGQVLLGGCIELAETALAERPALAEPERVAAAADLGALEVAGPPP